MSSADHAQEGVGYLEMFEFNRFVWAWDKGGSLASWLFQIGQINSTAEADVRVSTSTSPAMNLAATWIAADEISRLLAELNRFLTAEEVAGDKEASELAKHLGRAVSIADRRWPREDKPHRITMMRCGGCDQLTLVFRPPRFEGDAILVDCFCGYALTEDGFSWAVAVIEAERKDAG